MKKVKNEVSNNYDIAFKSNASVNHSLLDKNDNNQRPCKGSVKNEILNENISSSAFMDKAKPSLK